MAENNSSVSAGTNNNNSLLSYVPPQTIPTKPSKLLKIGNFRLGKTIGEG